MSDDAGVTVTGARELRATMKRAGVDLQDLKDTNEGVGNIVARAATARAPRRSGALAGSIRASKAAGRATVKAGSKRVPYAGVIHYGWSAHHIRPRPFVTEAAAATQPAWLDLYKTGIQTVLDKIRGE